jgi:antitoxin (DNA-binding transcriptional repressor) of toxin-antitoxin stability system
MRFLSVRDLRGKSGQVWRELPREKEMVVTSNGRPIAVLAAVNEANLDESLTAWRQVRASRAVAAIQRESVRKGTDRLTMDEIDAVIRRARAARRKRRV